MPNRFRADLIDVAWAVEDKYGVNPIAVSSEITAHIFSSSQTSTANELWGQW